MHHSKTTSTDVTEPNHLVKLHFFSIFHILRWLWGNSSIITWCYLIFHFLRRYHLVGINFPNDWINNLSIRPCYRRQHRTTFCFLDWNCILAMTTDSLNKTAIKGMLLDVLWKIPLKKNCQILVLKSSVNLLSSTFQDEVWATVPVFTILLKKLDMGEGSRGGYLK